MKLYLDEDISPKVCEILGKKGMDAVSAHETGMLEASDKGAIYHFTSLYPLPKQNNNNLAPTSPQRGR